MRYSDKEEEFYKWLKQRFELTLADASMIAQFLKDIKAENDFQTKVEKPVFPPDRY